MSADLSEIMPAVGNPPADQARPCVRILDLGAHDGFVSLWLARRLRERNIDVDITAVELMPEACDVARRRYESEGFRARVIQDEAIRGSHALDERTFDVVMAFELLEHVPSPSALLEACERACKPEGLVMISTPDGTFGDGRNPHHLYTWTLSQLLEMIRRRGSIEQALSGSDGISFVAYHPDGAKLGDVALYTGGGWQRWAPWEINAKGLGGSETAAVHVAQAWGRRDLVPTIFGDVERTFVENVMYEHYESFDVTYPRDVVVSSRIPELADARPNAQFLRLWLHDVNCGDRLTPERAERFDRIFALSDWHMEHLIERYPFIDGKVVKTRNGIDPGRWEGDAPERDPLRVLYTSSPDRGLDFLLRIWPAVHKETGAILAHAYSDVYDAVAQRDTRIGAFRREIARLSNQPGVEKLGSLGQLELADTMRRAALWVHPSWSTPTESRFHETFCIGALEAAASGCGIIGSDWGALAERISDFGGVGIARLDEDLWTDEIITALKEDLRTSEAAQALALEQTWDRPAADLTAR